MPLTKSLSSYLVTALLFIVLTMAAMLRFYNLNWDNGIFAHPDERSTVAFYAPTIQWPTDLSTIFDPRVSTLNPFLDIPNNSRRSYTYGHFPLYVLVLTAHALNALAPFGMSILPTTWTEFLQQSLSGHGYALIGRALMALADLGTVYLIFLLGRRLYGEWGGLLAATLSTFTVLQIQLAHFFAVDPVSTTFTMLALYGSFLMVDRPSKSASIVTGIGIGLAVASKFSALPIIFAPMIAVILATDSDSSDGQNKPSTFHKWQAVVLALGVAFVLFAVTSPFVLLDFENFRQAVIEEQGRMVSGEADFPFTRQYRGTTAYWYFIEQQLRWGMGWPLGVLATAGTLWVIFKAIRLKAKPGEWLALSWVVLYFGPTGLFLAKFMRYMLPVVPLFTLFGAGLVIELWQFAERVGERNYRFILRTATLLLAIVALGGSMVWSLAFVNGVYGTDHSWVIFARWTYANVPNGSCIAWEHWDDRMPTDLPEPNSNPGAHGYNQPILPMYEEDTAEKYELLRNTLMNCDYIVLATNRLWRTIPRLPQRYPMSSRYYQSLFSGKLGFEQVYATETPPKLGSLVIDDQSADESFTVYDHPKPILFQKKRNLSMAEWDALLGHAWQTAKPGYVGEPTLLTQLRRQSEMPPSSPTNSENPKKSLLLKKPVAKLPIVNDFRWNSMANNSTVVAVLFWWFMMMFIGALTWPMAFLLFNKLADRGYAFGKSLGVLLVSYFVWLNSSLGLLDNRVTTALVGLMLLLGFSSWILQTRRKPLLDFMRQQWRLIVTTEIIFTLIYLFFIYLRLRNPDLWQPWLGGEKMLEIGFLNAIVKSATMPPYDPFFAGGIINYYYYGLFIVGVLIKLTGIQPSIAFNLAIPTLAALTAINVFSLANNLSQPKNSTPCAICPTSFIAILFVIFIGNLAGVVQLLDNLGQLSKISFESAIPGLTTIVSALDGLRHLFSGEHLATYNYWDPTRVIPQTINEFPYFSFLFADLHPHMIGIPFTVLFLSLAYNWLAGTEDELSSEQIETIANEPIETVANEPIETIANEHVETATNDQVETTANEHAETVANEPIETVASDPIETVANEPIETATSDPIETVASEPIKESFARSFIRSSVRYDQQNVYSFLRFLALPFVLGALAVINTWDLPTYFGLMLATFIIGHYRRSAHQQSEIGHENLKSNLLKGILFTVGLLGITYLLYAPFFANYQALDVGLGLVHTQTPWDAHLKIWGFFLFIIVSWLWGSLLQPNSHNSFLRMMRLYLRRWNVWPHLSEIYGAVVKRETSLYQFGSGSIGLIMLLMAGLALLGYWVPTYLLPLVALAVMLLFRSEVSVETAFLNILTFTGLLLLLGVEAFFLRDFLGGGDYYRMNTLFKFYTQVWVIFGLAAAVMLSHLWRWNQHGSWAWQTVGILLLMGTLVYPIFGTPIRLDDRFPGEQNRPVIGTLDGLAYMTVGKFEWPAGNSIQLKYDYEAIGWLQNNVLGTPIIAESKIGYYREGGMRVAAYTGLPSILGGLHQGEQRYASQVGERDALVNEFWTNPDTDRTWQLIQQLNLSYIYLGQVERITHGNSVADKFELLRARGVLEVVFENEQTKIYQRKPS